MKKFRYIFISFILFANLISAQDSLQADNITNFFRFQYSNDFMHNTDQYFTNGFLLEYYNPVFSKNPISQVLIPSFKSKVVLEGISLTQDIFTPHELTDIIKQKKDRPFAAYLLLGFKRILYAAKYKLRITSELQLGVIGKLAMGKQTQNGIHDLLPTSSWVYGWENQISNDFCIDYFVEAEKNIYSKNWFELNWIASFKLGSPFTCIDGGTTFRIGKFDQKYLRGFEYLSDYNWQGYFFADLRGRLIGYNATLQGGLFNNNSVYTIEKINRTLLDLVTGITYSINSFKVEIAQHYLSKEFPGAKVHRYSYLNLRFGF